MPVVFYLHVPPTKVFGEHSDQNELCRIGWLHSKKTKVEPILTSLHHPSKDENERQKCEDKNVKSDDDGGAPQEIVVTQARKKKDADGDGYPYDLLLEKGILDTEAAHCHSADQRYSERRAEEKPVNVRKAPGPLLVGAFERR